MKKPTKAEERAAQAVRGYAAGTVPWLDAWEAVWDVSMDRGWWDGAARLVWFAHLSGVTHAKQLIACGLSGPVTDEEIRYRFDLGPKPPAEEADARQVAFNRAVNRARFLEGLVPEFRRVAGRLKAVAEEIGQLVEHTEPVEEPK